MQWDEVFLFVSSVLLAYSVVRRIVVTALRRNRVERETVWMTVRATWQQFRADGLRGEEIILIALVVPALQLAMYYALLLLPGSMFETDTALRTQFVRPAIFTSNVILTIYFLNGRLTRAARELMERWKRQPRQS